MSRIAVLGTGLLGAGFALRLLDNGQDVVVWNRTASKTEPLVQAGATAAASPAEAVDGAERAHLVLTADTAVDAVIEAAMPGLSRETWLVDHSTCSPDGVARRYQVLRAEGVRYVPAPVFMAPSNAREGTGLMLLSAPDDEAALLTPALQTMTGKVWHVGARPELAAIYKICGNGVLITTAGLMGDLYRIGQHNDLSPDEIDALFDHFQLGPIFPRIGGRVQAAPDMKTSFALSMARKDIRLMIEAADGRDRLAVLPGVADAMDAAIEAGDGDSDFAVYPWRDRDAVEDAD